MSDFDQFVPDHLRRLAGYTPGKPQRQAEKESGVSCIKLASNENPFGPSPRAVEAMSAALASTNLYPDNDVSELRAVLAERHNLAPDQVVVAAGSTALLGIIARTLLATGLNAVTSERSFIVYPIAVQAAGGRLILAPMRSDAFDLDALLAAITPETRIVFIANPNNPTGTLLPPPEIERFLDRVPGHVIVVLDEAYSDFAAYFATARGVEYSRSLDYLRAGRKIVVLRTFSKAHGLAGIRIGYGMGPAELMRYFARMRTTFSVSGVAQAGALAALRDQKHTQMALENNAEGVSFLTENISEMGFRPVPTCANFIYCDIGEDASAFSKRLQNEGVIIRPLGPWGAPNAIRITIGTPDQNRQFLAALKKVTRAQVPSR
jgi:histidinol-phosphate aminotransferase